MTYRTAVAAALDWGRRQLAALEASLAVSGLPSVPTVQSAIESYAIARKTRSLAEGKNAEGRLRRHVLTDAEFASTKLTGLRAKTIETWRTKLPIAPLNTDDTRRGISPATVNRLLNDLRAALNASAERHRAILPASIAAEIKVGTRGLRVASGARLQLLSDEEIARLVEVAFDLNEDFGWLVLLYAVTGARHGQLSSLHVGDVQLDQMRIMVPAARKGRASRPKPPIATPVGAGTLARMAALIAGREPAEPLLQTWAYRQVAVVKWERVRRRPWGSAWETDELWAKAKTAAGVDPSTVRYAFRHSSIVRGLLRGLPVRLVAALHDTSSEMIEAHYSAYILDASVELSRRAVLDL